MSSKPKQPKLLLDENIGKRVAAFLRQKGYDVRSILEDTPGIEDTQVLEKAVKERRVVATLDKDFGELVFHHSKQHVGVLFLRLKNETAESVSAILLDVIAQYNKKLYGKFTTASENDVRIR